MAYDEHLGNRVAQLLDDKKIAYIAKKMMGGLCFMVEDKMCVGIVKDDLMARIGLEAYEAALQKPGCKEMNFTGRTMKGYVFLDSSLSYAKVPQKWLDNNSQKTYSF